MDKVEAPLERRFFETREQEDHYVAVARGFGNVAEMRDYYKSHPLPGRRGETRSDAGDIERRLTVLKLEDS